VCGAAARIALVGDAMRFDESYAFVYDVRHSLGHIVSSYPFPGGHFLYSILAHGWLKLFGDSVWAVRGVAILAGVALIPVAYLAARALYDGGAAIWAAALCAGFAPLVDYSANGRAYILGVLLATAALALAARLVDRPEPVRGWVAFAACCTLAMYCVPTFVYAVATVALWAGSVALLRRDRRVLVRLAVATAAAVAVAVLLYIPTFGQSGWDYADAMSKAAGPLTRIVQRPWDHWARAVPNPLVWLVAAGFVASLLAHRRIARHAVPLAAPALAVALVAVAAQKASPFARTWLYVLPLYLIHAGAGLSYLAERIRVPRAAAAGAALAIAVVLAVTAVDHGETDNTQLPSTDTHIVGFLERELSPGEPVILDAANVGAASLYYVARENYAPAGVPRKGPATTALVVVRNREGRARVPGAIAEAGRRLAPSPPPRLVRRLELVEAWEARLLPSR
jgi:mannosyltransferase